MFDEIDRDRRRLVGAAAMTLVASQFTFNGTAEAQLSKPKPANLGQSSRVRTHRSRR